MTSLPMHDGTAVPQHYLQQAAALRKVLLAAIDAIAQNSLPNCEQSLWQQEMLANGLRRNLQLLKSLHLQPQLLTKLRAANTSLQQVSRTYQGLIGQVSQSTSLLQGVCTLYGQTPNVTHHKQQLHCEA